MKISQSDAFKRCPWCLNITGHLASCPQHTIARLRAEVKELRRRIREARKLLSPLNGEPADVPLWDVDRVLDLRRKRPAKKAKGR